MSSSPIAFRPTSASSAIWPIRDRTAPEVRTANPISTPIGNANSPPWIWPLPLEVNLHALAQAGLALREEGEQLEVLHQPVDADRDAHAEHALEQPHARVRIREQRDRDRDRGPAEQDAELVADLAQVRAVPPSAHRLEPGDHEHPADRGHRERAPRLKRLLRRGS